MLSAVFHFHKPSIGSDPIIRALLRSYALERPRGCPGPPGWDLNKVLEFLRSDRFKPLEAKTLRLIYSEKTIFSDSRFS